MDWEGKNINYCLSTLKSLGYNGQKLQFPVVVKCVNRKPVSYQDSVTDISIIK